MRNLHPFPAGRLRRLSPTFLSRISILLLALVLVACAGANAVSSSPTPSSTPTFISTSGNDLVKVVEQSPVAGAVTVNVTETEFAFVLPFTVFHPGVHYYFVVHNIGKQTHAFTIVPTYADGTPMDEYYQYDHMLVELDTIPPGTTQTINHTFTQADVGYYEVACRMRGHYMAGMHRPIQIK